jgi:serine/threonine protein kinase
MNAGDLPFASRGTTSALARIIRGQFDMKEHFSAELKDLLRRVLTPSPNARISLDEVFEHPWVKHQFPQRELGDLRAGTALAASPTEVAAAITEAADAVVSTDESAQSQTRVALPTPAMTGEDCEMVHDLLRHKSFTTLAFVERKSNTRFGIRGEPNDVVVALLSILKGLDVHVEQKVYFTLKATLEAEGDLLTFSLTIQSLKDHPGITVVEVRRGRGSTLRFHACYRSILSQISGRCDQSLLLKYEQPEETYDF